MIIQPRIRGFICTTAHPVGCAQHVQEQIDYVKGMPPVNGPKKVLVIGASTGYGLASRIVATFGAGADTIGVFFEKPASENRTATAGWYNSVAFEKAARREGFFARSINGDAFSDEIKQQTIDMIRSELGQVDMVVYSLASPRRKHPKSGLTYSSVLKPVDVPFTNKTVDVQSGEVTEITIEPATEDEIEQTIAVMGGEDWEMWMKALDQAGVLAKGAVTVAYSYIGSELTRLIYRDGTIGKAKDDLEKTAAQLNAFLETSGGSAYVSVNKAVVTQASSAIPVVPLYISLLFKIMKEKQLHENCIQQMYRLFSDRLFSGQAVPVDHLGRIRLDELELREDVQALMASLWEKVNTDNLPSISDIASYRQDFLRLFGFEIDGVDYNEEVDPDLQL